MIDNDRRDFAEIIAAIWSIHDRRISAAMIDVYWLAARHLDLADVRRALIIHEQNEYDGQYIPKPADITRIVNGFARVDDDADLELPGTGGSSSGRARLRRH